jgi:hypothetical protein
VNSLISAANSGESSSKGFHTERAALLDRLVVMHSAVIRALRSRLKSPNT